MDIEHDNLEEAFKKRLAEKGIPYFGAVEKHYLHDARGRKYPHAPNQPPHGRRPGKRTLMTGLRALANRKPDLDIPKWNEMLEMGHGEVLRLFEHHFGEVKPEGGVVRRVEVDPNDNEGFNRDEERANSDAKTLPGAGKQGENLRVDQFPVTRMLDGKKPAKPRQRLVPRHRRPGKDVVDYHEAGHANEGTRARRAGAGAPAARGPFNRNPESMVGEGRRPATQVPNNEPARRVRRNRLNVRPAAPAKARGFEENRQRGEAAARGVGNNQARNHIMDMLRNAKGQENLDDLAANLRAAAGQIERGDHPDIDSKFARVYRGIADELQGRPKAGETPVSPKPAHAGTNRPDEAATRAAREAGVPKTNDFRELPTKERVQFREFNQNEAEVKAGLEAAKAEIQRNIRDNKNVNVYRIAGRLIDERAYRAKQGGRPLNQERADAEAAQALNNAEKMVQELGGKFIQQKPEKKVEWGEKLAQRYNIRHRGKPEGEVEEGRAREIDRHEKFREDENAGWQRGGRVRDRLKPRGEGQNEPKPAEARAAAPRAANRRVRPPAGGAVRDQIVSLPSVPRDAERAMVIKDVLASGEQKDTGHKVGGGVTGSHPVVAVEKPGGEKVAAVRKNKDANALQEEFAADFIHAIGGQNIMPVVARDEDGAALMEYVNGKVAHDVGVYDPNSLKAQLAQGYNKDGMGRDEAVKAAERDVNLMQVADYLLGNDDRHGANFMLNDKGKLQLIDNGLIGRGDDKIYRGRAGAKATEPRLRTASQGGSYRNVNKGKVLPEVREAVGKVTREDILRMAGNLQGSTPSTEEIRLLERAMDGPRDYRDYIASEAYIDAIWARIEQIRDHGYFEYRGI